MEVPDRSAGRAAPPVSASAVSASAKAPPPPPSRELEPHPDEEDFDEAPTSMFVHPVKYTYDPDAPPQQVGLLDDEDDDDDDEPPTAIHMSPYRDATPGMPEVAKAPPPAPVPAAGSRAQPAQPSYQAPAQSSFQVPAQQGFAPPGLANQPAQQQRIDPRMFQTQQLPVAQLEPPRAQGQTGSGVATPAGDPMATFVDPDAAPVWLKAVALSSVVSALTVLGVLGWMLTGRF